MTTTAAMKPAMGFSSLASRPNAHDPLWLVDIRRDASAWVSEHGLPTSKDEDWRYMWLKPILAVPFEPSGLQTNDDYRADVVAAHSIQLGGTRIVFVNGHFAPDLSRVIGLPEGSRVSSLASELAEGGDWLQPYFSRHFEEGRDAFAALNTALFTDGVFIDLPADTTVETPIELLFFTDGAGDPVLSSPRSLILARPRSQMTIVENYCGVSSDLYLTNAVTEIVLGADARVEHYNVQDESESAFYFASLVVRQDHGSCFSSHLIALGSGIARHEVRIYLEGEGAEVNLDGLFLPHGNQHHDHPILVEHRAPRCTSRQIYKGVMGDRSHGVFNGHVVVHPGAVGTDATQTNKNLLLTDSAEVDTRPRLEIFADDVACSHGASVGRLDEEALFYLRSRGIAEGTARGLLTYGFARELVDRISVESLRVHVDALIAERFMGGGDAQTIPRTPGANDRRLLKRLP